MIPDLDDLITAYFAGEISDNEFRDLETRLESDDAAKSKFVKRAKLESALRDQFSGMEDQQLPKPVDRNPIWLWASVSLAILCALAVGWLIRSPENASVSADVPALGVAVISAEANADWDRPIGRGSALPPGKYALKRGLAQIDFFGGATVSIAGPAEIELVGAEEAILHSGKIRANVPPAARGFEIRAADVLVEDLGTSFGLEVNVEGRSGLVVFDGEVRTHARDRQTRLLKTGDAVSLHEGIAARTNASELSGFPNLSDIIAGSGEAVDDRYAIWKAASELRQRDSRLIAYYDFEGLEAASRRLENRALQADASELDGGIVGARAAEGRWPGKTALDFRREGDRVRFMIPGEFDRLTLVAWVRIDALDRHLNSLFLTDYFDENEIHWQLSNLGALHFACSPRGVEDLPKHNRRFYSDRFWSPAQSGRWFMLATTADRSSRDRSVQHFINGEPVGFSGGTNREKQLPKMRIGKADLGNWTDPIWPDAAIRTLNGRIDEFAIYSDVLSPEEIVQFYEEGRP
ncbi:MAG: LamG-like jellyroll fold domain-containing protein [Verrucomicrobiota bacterium]